MRSIASFLVLLVLALAGAGCSDNKRLAIQGTVELNGTHLSAGIVKFYGPGDHSSMTYLQPDGSFTITDVPPGEVKVSVEPAPAGGGIKPVPIPPRYRNPNTSGLVFTIPPKTGKLEIKLD
jgi:hypothetical protein